MRFIPACAGNSGVKHSIPPLGSVHPRVCGEQTSIPMRRDSPYGSSPRVRGTVSRTAWAGCPARFIPACAGNSRPSLFPSHCGTVHPRVCGEQARPVRPSSVPSVHPRVCGEQTTLYVLDITHFPRGWKSYRYNARRNSPPWSGHPLSGLSGIGVKLTSFSPSKSRGIRRFVPTVSKSNP